MLEIIPYERCYLEEIIQLFNTTIQQVNSKDYTQGQLGEWFQTNPDYESWHKKLKNSYSVLVVNHQKLLGFGNITDEGYLDLLYVASTSIYSGVGSLIYNALESYALSKNVKRIYTDASITAVPFFKRQGFDIKRKQDNIRNKEVLINYRMEKTISKTDPLNRV